MSEPKLLGCPFCGTHDVRIADHGRIGRGFNHHNERVFTIGCYQCGAQLPGMYEDHGRNLLIQKWNTRAKPEHGEG
ncbi:Lar family restriction alleviation protein [Ralstonia pseudosolanacearum]|uniref:Lar family restriction alleviation protein n=1 Tax=Ralstonia pseudosolanacearum TaxID=1310165 RepID=UPI00336A64D7